MNVYFYDPQKDSEGLTNKIVSWLDGPFCHCELQFDGMESYSMYLGTEIITQKREYDMQYYTKIAVKSSILQDKIARAKIEEMKLEKKKCTLMAMSSCFLNVKMHTNQTFCSEMITEVLLSCGLLDNIEPDKTSPSALYRKLHVKYIGQASKGSVTVIDFVGDARNMRFVTS